MESKITNKDKTIKDLQLLLDFVPISQLRKTILTSLFGYIQGMDVEVVPEGFKEMVEDHFFLIDFLDKLEVSMTNDKE